LILEAKAMGLDGFCLTEHQALPDLTKIKQLGEENGVKIFQGNEITTAQGDVLVFGLDKNIQGIITAKKLKKEVDAVKGFSIAAHPFRGFKIIGLDELELDLEQACKRKIFKYVNAVEIKNGRVSEKENTMAQEVAQRLGLPGTAGSDVHTKGSLGKWVTVFDHDIQNEAELVKALWAGDFSTGSLKG
jgi:predicted metal-dependent phosphoesterase TrpH